MDADTGRGVPLVELKTVSAETFYTDSNGIVAVNEPDLLGHSVWFGVRSHGYDYPADGFGSRGVALDVKAGGSAQIKLKRVNVAERLYRLTGSGIYRDSVLTGQPVPIKEPLLDGLVTGQDTVMAAPYKGRLYWFFGDTNRPAYPLGLFATSGATSALPAVGGLDPSRGVDLTYWVGTDGFSRAMLPLPGGGGPIWVSAVFTLKDAQGREHLYTHYTHLGSEGRPAQHGLAVFNDDKAVFEPAQTFAPDAPLFPDGQPLRVSSAGRPYLYFQSKTLQAAPLVRVRAELQHVQETRDYQAFTCLPAGGRYDGAKTVLDRDKTGRLVYGWKTDAAVLGDDEQKTLLDAGALKPDEILAPLRDVQTDAPIHSHGGSVFWNPYRRRWVMISGQASGTTSYLGEIWFAEADTPVGPWVYARKIVTHDRYTFYNPTQHPFFDQDGGRLIYFEGTYTDTYAGAVAQTPRYNYNQIMYRLALDDARLALPVPIYQVSQADGRVSYAPREGVGQDWHRVQSVPFFAVPPGRVSSGRVPSSLVPISAAGAVPLFYALPLTPAAGEKPSPGLVTLYEYRDRKTHGVLYSTLSQDADADRQGKPLGRVWRNPSSVLALDADAVPAP